jgi:hypothetical protein
MDRHGAALPRLVFLLPHERRSGISNGIANEDHRIGSNAFIRTKLGNTRPRHATLTFSMPCSCKGDPCKAIYKGDNGNDLQTSGAGLGTKEGMDYVDDSLDTQYENRSPILLCDGSVFTRTAPTMAGMYSRTPEYALPSLGMEASVTPTKIATTGEGVRLDRRHQRR